MARIEFRPVCSKCKQVIFGTVGLSDQSIGNYYNWLTDAFTEIEPRKCPHCGAYFKSIVMTDRIPFTNYPEEDENE